MQALTRLGWEINQTGVRQYADISKVGANKTATITQSGGYYTVASITQR